MRRGESFYYIIVVGLVIGVTYYSAMRILDAILSSSIRDDTHHHVSLHQLAYPAYS